MVDEIRVTRADPHKVGGCNFCARDPGRAVYVLGSDSPYRKIEVRVCPPCAEKLLREFGVELT